MAYRIGQYITQKIASFLLVFKVLANVIYLYLPTLCGLIGHNLYSVIKAFRNFLLFLYSSPPYFFHLIFGKKCSKPLSVNEKLINQKFCLSDLYRCYPEIVVHFDSFFFIMIISSCGCRFLPKKNGHLLLS